MLQFGFRGLIAKAVTDDDSPTPGYLYNDIASKFAPDRNATLTRLNRNYFQIAKGMPSAGGLPA